MIIAKILAAFYVLYFLNKTERLKNLKDKEKIFIYLFLALLIISDTQITFLNFKFNFLIVGIVVILFEILIKNIKRLNIKTNYIFLKIYTAILLVLLLYRGGLWILQT